MPVELQRCAAGDVTVRSSAGFQECGIGPAQVSQGDTGVPDPRMMAIARCPGGAVGDLHPVVLVILEVGEIDRRYVIIRYTLTAASTGDRNDIAIAGTHFASRVPPVRSRPGSWQTKGRTRDSPFRPSSDRVT
jgi:hypothetical protein